MAIRYEKQIQTSKYKVDAKAELYTCAREVVNDGKNRPIRHRAYDVIRHGIKRDWHGVSNYNEALDLLDSGYQPVVEKLREELKVTPKSVSPRFAFNNSVQGFMPIVPLALKCVPNSMIDMRIRPIKSKVLDIYYDMTATSENSPEAFVRAGKILLGTILALESQGYKFNLYAVQTYWDSRDYANHAVDVLCVKIKSSDRPFDLKRMSFPLAHPAFFRVIGFDWQSKSPITRYIGDGRGRGIDYDFSDNDCNKIMKGLFGDNVVYLSCSRLIGRHYDKETLKEVLVNEKAA